VTLRGLLFIFWGILCNKGGLPMFKMELEDVIHEIRLLQIWLYETKFDHRSQVNWINYELENILLKYDKQIEREKHLEQLMLRESAQ
jgi:hypothetical protein